MTIDADPGSIWIIGALAAAASIRQVVLLFKDLKAPERTPPLPEEIAKTYVTRREWKDCRDECKQTNDSVRMEIKETDRKAEERAIGTHRRMDKLSSSVNKMCKGMGILIGIQIAEGKGDPKKMIRQLEETDDDQ